MSAFWKTVGSGAVAVGKKILKPKKKSVFVKDKSGTITGVTPGSFKKKKNWPPGPK